VIVPEGPRPGEEPRLDLVQQGADPRLDKAALDAVRKWTYKPARDAKGKPVAVIFTVTIRFALQ